VGTSIAASLLRDTTSSVKHAETQQSFNAVQAKVTAENAKNSVSQVVKSDKVEIRSDNNPNRGGNGAAPPVAVYRKSKRAYTLDSEDYLLPSMPNTTYTIDITV
jgi:hypothetical protein